MLAKPAVFLMGIIYEKPVNAYEIIKKLECMNMKWWFKIADSTVYATIKNLQKREFINGYVEKAGNMPDRTVYSLTASGKTALFDSLRKMILTFDYDMSVFSIAVFYIHIFPAEERKMLLLKRLSMLIKYAEGIEKQARAMKEEKLPENQIANVQRMFQLAKAEIMGVKDLLNCCT